MVICQFIGSNVIITISALMSLDVCLSTSEVSPAVILLPRKPTSTGSYVTKH